jgi:hypothetical protein
MDSTAVCLHGLNRCLSPWTYQLSVSLDSTAVCLPGLDSCLSAEDRVPLALSKSHSEVVILSWLVHVCPAICALDSDGTCQWILPKFRYLFLCAFTSEFPTDVAYTRPLDRHFP